MNVIDYTVFEYCRTSCKIPFFMVFHFVISFVSVQKDNKNKNSLSERSVFLKYLIKVGGLCIIY